MSRLEELAEYYGTNDTSADMASGHWEQAPPESDPMVTTSLRLPKSLLDAARRRADKEGVKTTAWIRTVVERALAEPVGDSLEDRVQRLEHAVFRASA